MAHLFDYLIKLSGTLIVLYLFYWLVLRRLTFYTCNRWYLLGYSIAAFFLPLINITQALLTARLGQGTIVNWVPVISVQDFAVIKNATATDEGQLRIVILSLIGAGIVLMVIRFCFQYFSLQRIRRSSRIISDGEVKVYHNDKNIIPFSFGNSIFINSDKHSEDELRDIIRHEFIHVKQKHTIDMVISECLCILNWYNPFAWLIRKAIRQNLEFIADNKVLKNGIDKKQYQYLLLKVVGEHQYGIVSNFNFTSLKKRIAMMNKVRSAKLHLVKFLFVFPLLAVILVAFRNNNAESMSDKGPIVQNPVSIDNSAVEILFQDTLPPAKKLPVKSRAPLEVNANSKGYIITVADNYGESIVIIRDKQNKIVKAMSLAEWQQDEAKNKDEYGEILPPPPPPLPAEIPLPPLPAEAAKAAENISSLNVQDKKLTVVTKDGETEVYDLDKPEQKEAFEKKYKSSLSPKHPMPNPGTGSKPNKSSSNSPKSVPSQSSKPDPSSANDPKPSKISDKSTVVLNNSQPIVVDLDPTKNDILKLSVNFDGIIILDGKEYTRKAFETAVKLNVNSIKSVNVYKNETAIQVYGEKAKNGVIEIQTQ